MIQFIQLLLLEICSSKNSLLLWFWNHVCTNDKLTISILAKNEEKYKWNWRFESLSYNKNITLDFIKKYPEEEWQWDEIISNSIYITKKQLNAYLVQRYDKICEDNDKVKLYCL